MFGSGVYQRRPYLSSLLSASPHLLWCFIDINASFSFLWNNSNLISLSPSPRSSHLPPRTSGGRSAGRGRVLTCAGVGSWALTPSFLSLLSHNVAWFLGLGLQLSLAFDPPPPLLSSCCGGRLLGSRKERYGVFSVEAERRLLLSAHVQVCLLSPG